MGVTTSRNECNETGGNAQRVTLIFWTTNLYRCCCSHVSLFDNENVENKLRLTYSHTESRRASIHRSSQKHTNSNNRHDLVKQAATIPEEQRVGLAFCQKVKIKLKRKTDKLYAQNTKPSYTAKPNEDYFFQSVSLVCPPSRHIGTCQPAKCQQQRSSELTESIFSTLRIRFSTGLLQRGRHLYIHINVHFPKEQMPISIASQGWSEWSYLMWCWKRCQEGE